MGHRWARHAINADWTFFFFEIFCCSLCRLVSSGEMTALGQGRQGRWHRWALQGYSQCRSCCCCCGSGTQHRGFHSCRTPGSGASPWVSPTSQPPCRAPCRDKHHTHLVKNIHNVHRSHYNVSFSQESRGARMSSRIRVQSLGPAES